MTRRLAAIVLVLVCGAEGFAGTRSGAVHPAPAASQTLAPDRIHAAVLQHAQEQMGSRGLIQVELPDPPDTVSVPAGALTLAVESSGSVETLGRRLFRVSVAVNGREHDRLKVVADVALVAEVATALRALKSDEVIEPEDVALAPIRLTTLRHDYLSAVDSAVGKRVLKPVPSGAAIHGAALGEPYSVKKGDRVTIEARRGGLYVQATGVTKAGARIGQTVAVTNQDSGREVRARVVGPGLVQVEF
jgi:flagella basal body P-ring formation protein FlgA